MIGIQGKRMLVLGGGGMVGMAVCRGLLPHRPARIAVAARREAKARRAVGTLRTEFPEQAEAIVPVWGDVFLRAEWRDGASDARAATLTQQTTRRQAIADVLDPLDENILNASLLARMITGVGPGVEGAPAEIVIDCMNTATAVSYQNIYALAHRFAALPEENNREMNWRAEVETLIAALSVPQLVRHVQILYAAMREAGTQAYVKVGTSGTGGMGFNIPYTHGEEKPSRLLLAKAALAGAQTMLTFLMARTPDAPPLVREIKPAAMIGWHAIGHGVIRRRGMEIPLFDCPPGDAVPLDQEGSLAPRGEFGVPAGTNLEGVYIDTGENGLFSADEFGAITTLGQMQMITPEEVARDVVAELRGTTTGHDIVGALDGAVSGPTYRGGYLRQAALTRLRALERQHGQAVAYEILGPPRLAKLLYEAHLLRSALGEGALFRAAGMPATALAGLLARRIADDAALRRRILSIGIPILLPDGAWLMRGPEIKSANAHDGWVDLTPENMERWQGRLAAMRREAEAVDRDSSSRAERLFALADGDPAPGEMAGWIFLREEGGARQTS